MSEQNRIAASWHRVEAWLAVHAPKARADLRPPATEEAIRDAEEALGVALPDAVRGSFRVHDGQSGLAAYIMDGWMLLPLEFVVSEWRFLLGMLESGQWVDTSGEPIGPVQPRWWMPAWIPLLSNGCGDYQCVDLAPAPGGTRGQIVQFWHTDGARSVVAETFGSLLDRIADDYSAEDFVVNEDGWIARNTSSVCSGSRSR